jgi:hypothetical protein
MPLFDEKTSFILNSILVEGITPKTKYKLIKTKSQSSSGGFGVGGPKIDSIKRPIYNKPWTGTEPAPKTVSVPGGNIPRQVSWGKLKQLVDPMVDHYYDVAISGVGSIPIVGGTAKVAAASIVSPATRFATKQLIKTDLAKRYLGLGTIGKEGSLGDMAADAVMSGLNLPQEMLGMKPQFGILGQKIGDKIGDIAKMGIDPLDWVTKAFGADQAASHVENIGASQSLGTTTAAGYLGRGKRSGIY